MLLQLRDEAEKILGALGLAELILLHEDVQDLLELSLLAKQVPDARADRIQAEIDALLQLQHDELALEILEEHPIGNPDARREGESACHDHASWE